MTIQLQDRPAANSAPVDASVHIRGAGKDYVAIDGALVTGLKPVSLDIKAGSFVSLVGRSGCGKSTLLRLVAGLETPTSGEITIGAEPVLRPPRNARYVFQNYGESLLPWRSVAENVRLGVRHAFGDAPSGLPGENEQIAHYLAEVGLSGTGDRLPKELSGGMQQRVAIARALASRPRVLLLDEPFSAVDALSRGRLQQLILRLWDEHKLTVLFVTHDIDEALFLSDRVVVLGEKGAGVAADLDVAVPRPRHPVLTPEHKDYLSLRREIFQLVSINEDSKVSQ